MTVLNVLYWQPSLCKVDNFAILLYGYKSIAYTFELIDVFINFLASQLNILQFLFKLELCPFCLEGVIPANTHISLAVEHPTIKYMLFSNSVPEIELLSKTSFSSNHLHCCYLQHPSQC